MTVAFITGITGMVGSHLVDYLLDKTDWDIYGLVRWNDKMNNIEHLMQKINEKDRVHLVYGDTAVQNILDNTKIKLKRRILGD